VTLDFWGQFQFAFKVGLILSGRSSVLARDFWG